MTMTTPENIAQSILETIPQVMSAIRCEMRRHRTAGLSVPQFRVLTFLNLHHQSSLSAAAEYLGMTLPSMSRMVESLVARRLLERHNDEKDRRYVTLNLTSEGKALLEIVLLHAREGLAQQLGGLSPADRTAIATALHALHALFAVGVDATPIIDPVRSPVEEQ